MTHDFNKGIRSLCSPTVQRLYGEFDAACDRHDYEAADAILLQISDINACEVLATAFAPTESTWKH